MLIPAGETMEMEILSRKLRFAFHDAAEDFLLPARDAIATLCSRVHYDCVLESLSFDESTNTNWGERNRRLGPSEGFCLRVFLRYSSIVYEYLNVVSPHHRQATDGASQKTDLFLSLEALPTAKRNELSVTYFFFLNIERIEIRTPGM